MRYLAFAAPSIPHPQSLTSTEEMLKVTPPLIMGHPSTRLPPHALPCSLGDLDFYHGLQHSPYRVGHWIGIVIG